jgi:hypothetical protein
LLRKTRRPRARPEDCAASCRVGAPDGRRVAIFAGGAMSGSCKGGQRPIIRGEVRRAVAMYAARTACEGF